MLLNLRITIQRGERFYICSQEQYPGGFQKSQCPLGLYFFGNAGVREVIVVMRLGFLELFGMNDDAVFSIGSAAR